MAAHQRRLYAFIYSLVQDRHAADDVLQEVSAVLWRRFDEFEEGTNFSAWAYKVARLQVLSWRRKQAKLAIPIEGDELSILMDTAAVMAERQDERLAALEHCLSELTPKQIDLLRRRYHFGFSANEIAEQGNRSRRAIYKSLGKVNAILMSCISSKMEDPNYG